MPGSISATACSLAAAIAVAAPAAAQGLAHLLLLQGALVLSRRRGSSTPYRLRLYTSTCLP
jgi:hypothetical protein